MDEPSFRSDVYQLHVCRRAISPLIWRRLLGGSDGTIAEPHETRQTAMGCDDAHRHRVRIQGQDHGISRIGGLGFRDDPHLARL